jgi:hypothetical protein
MLHMRVSKGTADMWRAIAQARGVSLNQACRDQLERGEQSLPPELLARVLSYAAAPSTRGLGVTLDHVIAELLVRALDEIGRKHRRGK